MKTVDDCVAKLKNLDAKGRLWHQEMIMEVQGPYLLLNDIETKVGSSLLEEQRNVWNGHYSMIVGQSFESAHHHSGFETLKM